MPKTFVNGNLLEGSVLAAYTKLAARKEQARQAGRMRRKELRSYPELAQELGTEAYVRAYFRLNSLLPIHIKFHPCTYIIGGREVVL